MLLLVGCAQPHEPAAPAPGPLKPGQLGPLPATFVHDAGCPGCLAVTMTLRPDGSYLVRDQIGTSEFYDFGGWRLSGETLELAGGRDARKYPVHSLRRSSQLETLRGPFRLVGVYDGQTFKECRTGLAWRLSGTRAADALNQEYTKLAEKPALVALDAQFEGAPETLRVVRQATLLTTRTCPG